MDIKKLGRNAITILKTRYNLPSSGLVAGGSISNIIWELVSGNKAVINDIDIFILKDKVDKFEPYDRSKLFRYSEITPKPVHNYNGLSYSNNNGDFYSIIDSKTDGIFNYVEYSSNTDDYMIILKSFDINAVKCGYNIEDDIFYFTDDFIEFIKNKELKVTNLRTPYHTAIRIAKKSNELNVKIADGEFDLIKFTIDRYANDIIKQSFMEKYRNLYLKYNDILDEHFSLIDNKLSMLHVKQNYNVDVDLYTLKIKEKVKYNDNNLNNVSDCGAFLFYMHKVKGNPNVLKYWDLLRVFYNTSNYIDCVPDTIDIQRLIKLIKYLPSTIDNLRSYKLSEQIGLMKRILNTFKDEPGVALAILSHKRLDKNIVIDSQTALVLELSVRKHINNNSEYVINSILKYDAKESSKYVSTGTWDSQKYKTSIFDTSNFH